MKTTNRKIDIFLRSLSGHIKYECSTNWSKTCKEAKANFLRTHDYLDKSQVIANFAK